MARIHTITASRVAAQIRDFGDAIRRDRRNLIAFSWSVEPLPARVSEVGVHEPAGTRYTIVVDVERRIAKRRAQRKPPRNKGRRRG